VNPRHRCRAWRRSAPWSRSCSGMRYSLRGPG